MNNQNLTQKQAKKKCFYCGAVFLKLSNSKMFEKRKFCSDKCRNKNYRKIMKIAYEEYKKRNTPQSTK